MNGRFSARFYLYVVACVTGKLFGPVLLKSQDYYLAGYE